MISLGIRSNSQNGQVNTGIFLEVTGNQLVENGMSKFQAQLTSVIPGVMFIDEVYQLDPKNNNVGKSITNLIMEKTENEREKLTVIVAGYRNDVQEKWLAFNQGLPSRFPKEIIFDDFNEDELKLIFNHEIRNYDWELEPTKSIKNPLKSVDIASIAAKRLSRNSNRKGFANARSVRAMVETALQIASKRQKREEIDAKRFGFILSPKHDRTLTIRDVLGEPLDLSSSPTLKKLTNMIGLDDVKSSIKSLLNMLKVNYESELNGEGVLQIALHRLFLGNPGMIIMYKYFLHIFHICQKYIIYVIHIPYVSLNTHNKIFMPIVLILYVGTGKTVVAEIYGKLLKEMGYLSNGEVLKYGASELIGEYVGSTQTKVNKIFDLAQGKVLVIDEAYVLGRKDSFYGKDALDTIVERVQGTSGEDFAVILCGYNEEMLEMIREGNPGLKRRFRTEDAFQFTDYTDDQLTQIMLDISLNKSLYVTPELAKSAVTNVIGKLRYKPNFGNVGEVNNLLQSAQEKMLKRNDKRKIDGRWELLELDLFKTVDHDAALNAISHLKQADHIRDHIISLQKSIKVQLRNGKEPKDLLKNYTFIGPPGMYIRVLITDYLVYNYRLKYNTSNKI